MKLLAAVSHHGLGHLAQAAPVLNRLKSIQPDLDLTVWSGLSHAALAARIPFLFRHRAEAADVGLAMIDALSVDLAASHAAYLDFHRDWDQRVEREARWLQDQGFHGVFADVAYLPLAAAEQAGIPGVALCSLNWRDIAGAYLAKLTGMDQVLEQIARAYRQSRAFLRPIPAMPMPWLENRVEIAPVSARGTERREEMAQALNLGKDIRLVLVGFGGIGYRGALPVISGVTWLVPDNWESGARSDIASFKTLGGRPFLDMLASCDALLTKVGYGSFVEAVVHGIPLLYIDRPDWPETPFLADWLKRNGNALAMTEAEFAAGHVKDRLDRLWAMPARPKPIADGADVAARQILERMA